MGVHRGAGAMAHLIALNEHGGEEVDDVGPSVEAEETRLKGKYLAALQQQAVGEVLPARRVLESLLQERLVEECDATAALSPALLQLKFLALKNLARLVQQQGEPTLALRLYSEAALLDGEDCMLWYILGCLSAAVKRWTVARHALEQCLRLSPKNWLALEELQEVLLAVGDTFAGRRVCGSLLRLHPQHKRAAALQHAFAPKRPRCLDGDGPTPHFRTAATAEESDMLVEEGRAGSTCVEVHELSWAHLLQVLAAHLQEGLAHSHRKLSQPLELMLLLSLQGNGRSMSSKGSCSFSPCRGTVAMPWKVVRGWPWT